MPARLVCAEQILELYVVDAPRKLPGTRRKGLAEAPQHVADRLSLARSTRPSQLDAR